MNGRGREHSVSAAMLLALALAGGSPPALADVDVADYQAPGAVRSERERQRLQAEFARQREQEEQRARIEADTRERLAAAEAARLAARPYPLRLTESRCTVCHAATHFQQQAHTWPGWLAVVLRMKYFNHASLESVEIPAIVGHLAATYPAAGIDAAFELAVAPSVLGAAMLPLRWQRRRRKAGCRE